jgi:hypothetical protein
MEPIEFPPTTNDDDDGGQDYTNGRRHARLARDRAPVERDKMAFKVWRPPSLRTQAVVARRATFPAMWIWTQPDRSASYPSTRVASALSLMPTTGATARRQAVTTMSSFKSCRGGDGVVAGVTLRYSGGPSSRSSVTSRGRVASATIGQFFCMCIACVRKRIQSVSQNSMSSCCCCCCAARFQTTFGYGESLVGC